MYSYQFDFNKHINCPEISREIIKGMGKSAGKETRSTPGWWNVFSQPPNMKSSKGKTQCTRAREERTEVGRSSNPATVQGLSQTARTVSCTEQTPTQLPSPSRDTRHRRGWRHLPERCVSRQPDSRQGGALALGEAVRPRLERLTCHRIAS